MLIHTLLSSCKTLPVYTTSNFNARPQHSIEGWDD